MEEKLNKLLKDYKPSKLAINTVRSAKLLLLVGISGVGKDTLKQHLLAQSGFYNFISYTTRSPRSNHGVMEKDGEDYYFITNEEALRLLEAGEFIEAKRYSGNIYGTGIEGLHQSVETGQVAVNDVEVQGVDEYKTISSDVKAIFILPPSYEEWQRRWLKRYHGGVVDPKDINLRHETAKSELEFAIEKGYYEFVINDDVEDTVARIQSIVQGRRDENEHMRGLEYAQSLMTSISTH